ncbi:MULTISPECIES: hypothetical protein [Microbacterium]|uniref:MarR family transcriptional regulator n=3 Tax=Microbacterium TaxID=33882 RepID=A0A150H5A3_9MICO|nr:MULTISPECIES: hypothetical protein [Microbacterium]MBU4466004.1 hypothetical protein [Actinomycetota bacterium]KAB1881644.1 hypothetical protein F6W70_17440 [Microbacterium liquefaciens]KXZ57224.1 hypothetical protein Mlaev_02871 [Microbacterium laevaniformans]MBM7461654.1 hypothetical protein [Microbacterium dextranolyticum]QYG12390.1 hypothetical protein KY497_03650 [Microbacterium sp. PAMC22086]
MVLLTDLAPEHSKAMFGNSHMLSVMLFIANHDDDVFSAPQIVSATGVDPTLVHPLLGRLKKGQVIEQIGRVPGERTLLFRRIESPYWDLARRVAAEGPTASSPAA